MSVSERDEGGGRLKDAILIAGPTASGKSALALSLAERLGGAIVNTDSMQGYAVLRLLTARPQEADLARAPHHLFGHIPPTEAYSTGRWLRDVMGLIDSGRLDGRIPIFVGGTGLYFRALLGGLSEIPEIAPHIRERWRYRLLEEGATHLHSILNREDPAAAVRIRPNDGQRLVRALEVLESTGRSILDWQSVRGRALVDRASAKLAVLDPDRAELRGRIATRFEVMLQSGAVQEALAVDALALDPQLPAAKAIGLREMVDFASGRLDGHEAVTRAVIASHQYAKRQATWFRTQFDAAWRRFPAFGDALAEDPWFDVGGSGVG